MKKTVRAGKRIFCLVITAVLLTAQITIPSVRAAENDIRYIHNAEEFYALSKQCRTENFSTGKTFYLEEDLDLSEYENLLIPVMDGTFDGKGHRITGVSMEEDMSDYGLFRYVGVNGAVQNLTVEARLVSDEGQENIGIIVGNNAGTIRNCVSMGSINGQKSVGGIAGMNQKSGNIMSCQNEAEVDGKKFVGGIAGMNKGMISKCTNSGNINTNQKVLKTMDGEGSISISVPNAMTGVNSDDRANGTGGIAGNSSGEISRCKNMAVIGHEHLGYETGGIVGRQNGSVYHCSNEGNVYGRKDVGGITGYFEPFEDTSYDTDTSQELSDQIEELSDLVERLGDLGGQAGDRMSDNMEILKSQMRGLKDSLKGHMDNLDNLTNDNKGHISNQMDAVKNSIEAIGFDISLDQLDDHIADIESDMKQIERIMEELEPLLVSVGEDTKKEIENILGKYQEIQQLLEKLKEFIENAGGGNIPDLPEFPDFPDFPDVPNPTVGSGDGETPGDEGGSEEGSDPEGEGSSEDENDSESEGGSEEGSDSESKGSSEGENASESEGSSEGEEPPDDLSALSGSEEYQIINRTFKMPVLLSMPESVDYTGIEVPGQDDGHTEEEDSPGSGNGSGSESDTEDTGSSDSGENVEKLTGLLGELAEYNASIQSNIRKIAGVLRSIPDGISGLKDDFDRVGDSMETLTNSISDMMDRAGTEFKDLKADAQRYDDMISDSMERTADMLEADGDAISDQMDQIRDKFNNIRVTISDGFNELKERIDERSVYVDVSGFSSDVPGAGKIIACMNSGEIYSDSQGGGIAGSIMKEETFRVKDWIFGSKDAGEEDDEEEEEGSNSITKHVRALIFGCSNTSEVKIQNDYAGGIVGKADYGMISACQNYGDVVSKDGSYVGGIAGKSENRIKDSYALCGLDGAAYIGGVAGRGENISGSYVCAYMDMEDYVNSVGAIAGRADGIVENNYFADNGYGAVDGVTRSSEAVGMSYKELLKLKEMPEGFTVFKVRFISGEEMVLEKNLSYGSEFAEENYPQLTEYDGQYAYWEDKTISPVCRNVSVHAIYRAYIPSLSAGGEGVQPEVLLGGEFYPDSVLSVRELPEEEKEELLASAGDQLSGYHVTKAYFYEIEQSNPLRGNVSLHVKNTPGSADSIAIIADGELSQGGVMAAETEGSYLAVRTMIGHRGYIIVMDKANHYGIVIAIVLVIVVILLIALLLRNKNHRQKHTKMLKEAGDGTGNETENHLE